MTYKIEVHNGRTWGFFAAPFATREEAETKLVAIKTVFLDTVQFRVKEAE